MIEFVWTFAWTDLWICIARAAIVWLNFVYFADGGRFGDEQGQEMEPAAVPSQENRTVETPRVVQVARESMSSDPVPQLGPPPSGTRP